MEQMYEDLMRQTQPLLMISDSGWRPAFDVYETKTHLVIIGELSGVKKEDIAIVLEKDVLSITGKRVDPYSEKKERLHRMEIEFGAFERKIRISIPIQQNQIAASLKDGFLEIRIPKSEQNNYREIPVEGE